MTRTVFAFLTSALLSLSMLAGCCPPPQRPERPLVHDDEKQVAAVEAQLKGAERAGWSREQERAFSGHLATLSMKTRLEYAHRLARALTFGKIRMLPPPPPPENAPACPCGGNSCGVAVAEPPPAVPAPVKGKAERPPR